MTSNQEYWQRRFLQVKASQIKNTEAYEKALQPELNGLRRQMQSDIEIWTTKYANTKGLTTDEARKSLAGIQTKDWNLTLKQFEAKAKQGGYEDELNSEYYRSRIARLRELETQLSNHGTKFAGQQTKSMGKALSGQYEDTYMHNIYNGQMAHTAITSNFARFSPEQMQMVVSKPWAKDGKNFSARIWKNYRDDIPDLLMNHLLKGTLLGYSPDRITRNFRAGFQDIKRSNVHRLVTSEMAHITEEANAKAYEEMDIDQYEYMATLESHTCDICRVLDGKRFNVKDRVSGLNAPVMHPYCRCTTVPYMDDLPDVNERWSRDPETGKGKMVKNIKFDDWKAMVNGEKPIPEIVPTKVVKVEPKFDAMDMSKWPRGVNVMNNINGPELTLLDSNGRAAGHIPMEQVKKWSNGELKDIMDIVYKNGFSDSERGSLRNWFDKVREVKAVQPVATRAKHYVIKGEYQAVKKAAVKIVKAPIINNNQDFSNYLKSDLGYKKVAVHNVEPRLLQSMADSMAKTYAEYPELNGWIDTFTSGRSKVAFQAKYEPRSNGTSIRNHLTINPDYFKGYDGVMEGINRNNESGYSSFKTTPGGLITHELGHAIDNRAKSVEAGINRKDDLDFDKGWSFHLDGWVSEAIETAAIEKFGDKVRTISKYGNKDNAELIAEAISDESDNEVSAWIRKELKRRLKNKP